MISQPLKASITGMREGYGEYAVSQYNAVTAGIEPAINLLIEALDFIPKGDSYIHLVDLGAADGINSFPVIDQFSRILLKKREPLNLVVSHVDLPSADFNGLSHNLHNHKRSYRHTLAGENITLYSMIAPGSFYNTFLPAGSVDILISTTALHYASRRASKLSQHVHPLHAAGVEEKSAWDRLRDGDMNTALTNIHRCLKRGGKFWAVVPAHCRDETTMEIRNYWYREVLDVMCDQLRSLVNKGILDEERWNNFVLPVHQPNLQQWQKWFSENDSKFRLEFLYAEEQANPYLKRFRKEHKDQNRFADEYLSSVRAWSDKIITQLLPDQGHRSEFFEGLRDQFLQAPERFENDTFSAYIGATRV